MVNNTLRKLVIVHLLYLAKDTIAELKRKTTGMVPSADNTAVPNIARPLGLCNMTLPDMPIPTLPDKTIQNTEEPEPVPPKNHTTARLCHNTWWHCFTTPGYTRHPGKLDSVR